jgi:hypothetical protein
VGMSLQCGGTESGMVMSEGIVIGGGNCAWLPEGCEGALVWIGAAGTVCGH